MLVLGVSSSFKLQQTRQQRDENLKWVRRMKDDLRHQGSVDGGPRPATIFQIPVSVREVSEDSYNPKYFSFGPYNRRNPLVYTIRLDFIRIFQKITGKEWDDIYSKALEGKSIENWMKFYEGLKLGHQVEEMKDGEKDDGKKAAAKEDAGKKNVEENGAQEEPETFLTWEEETGKSFLVWDAIFVVCFLLADHYSKCNTCQRFFSFLNPLKYEIAKETVAPMVHLIRLDIFKFENQIPLGLIKNVYHMISSVYNDQPSTSTAMTGTPEHRLSFDRFVTDSMCSIYCDLPRPGDNNEFRQIVTKLGFERRRHLLECLYLVVCYQPNPPQSKKRPQPETAPESTVATDVKTPESDQQLTGGTGQLGSYGVRTDSQSRSTPKKGNALTRFALSIFGKISPGIGGVDEENQGGIELTQISNVGGGEGTSGANQDNTGKSVQGDPGPSQSSNVGGGEGTVSGAQADKGKSLQSDAPSDAGKDAGQAPQNNNGGPGEDTSGGAQRDKGKSLQIDADPGQNRKGGGGGGTTGKSLQIDAGPSQNSNVGRGEGRSGAQDDKGQSPQSDAGPPQNSNGRRGPEETRGGVQLDKEKSLQVDACADPGQSSNGGGGGGISGGIQYCDKGKSPQGDTGPSQCSNSGGRVDIRGVQHNKEKSPRGDTLPSGHSRDEDGDVGWFAKRRACILTWFFCQGCNGKPEHNHGQLIPTITKLRAANIAVKGGGGNATKWISEVNFRSSWLFSYKGELYLPIFGVYDETEALLRNLLVYEYIIVPKKRELRSFLHLMSHLINDEEDVRWMTESGVLKNNSLGSDKDVADMWKTMLSGVVIVGLSKQYQIEVLDKITKHSKKTFPKVVGELRLLYNNRWQRFGILAAFVTIAATVSAAVYTILTYYDGNKQRAQT